METISEIIEPAYRQWTGIKGAGTLMKVKTESDKVVTVFAPAMVGDRLEIEYNSEYHSWSGKVVERTSVSEPKETRNEAAANPAIGKYLVMLDHKADEIIAKLNRILPEEPTKVDEVAGEEPDFGDDDL